MLGDNTGTDGAAASRMAKRIALLDRPLGQIKLALICDAVNRLTISTVVPSSAVKGRICPSRRGADVELRAVASKEGWCGGRLPPFEHVHLNPSNLCGA